MTVSDLDKANVAKRIAELFEEAYTCGGDQFPELHAQNFSDSVQALMAKTNDVKLRRYIREQAWLTGEYCDSPGRWVYNPEEGDIEWHGPPLDWME